MYDLCFRTRRLRLLRYLLGNICNTFRWLSSKVNCLISRFFGSASGVDAGFSAKHSPQRLHVLFYPSVGSTEPNQLTRRHGCGLHAKYPDFGMPSSSSHWLPPCRRMNAWVSDVAYDNMAFSPCRPCLPPIFPSRLGAASLGYDTPRVARWCQSRSSTDLHSIKHGRAHQNRSVTISHAFSSMALPNPSPNMSTSTGYTGAPRPNLQWFARPIRHLAALLFLLPEMGSTAVSKTHPSMHL